MSPDTYLRFATVFVGYFLKVAVAGLLCWLLARLLVTPRRRFAIWLGFMLGSLSYWLYVVTSFSFGTNSTASAGAFTQPVSRFVHQFLVPAKFEDAIVVLGQFLASAYVVGVLLMLSGGIWKRIKLHFLLRQGRAPSSELQNLFSEMCRHFGLRRCKLLILREASSPATVYWLRPRIVLPEACEQLRDSTLIADILHHELAHVVRRDYLWSSMSDVICGLLFFHPGVWQARRQMRVHREMACDLAVVAVRPEHRADYAETLTRVARMCLPRKYSILGIDFASATSLLTNRVRAILNGPEESSRIKKFSRAVAGIALISGYGFLCSVLAITIVFAPSSPPARVTVVQTISKPQAARRIQHKSRRESPPQAENLITESPAYRITAAPGISEYTSELPGRSEDLALESNSFVGPSGARSQPAWNRKPVSTTIGSIVAATVGTVIASDKDDHSKRKRWQ